MSSVTSILSHNEWKTKLWHTSKIKLFNVWPQQGKNQQLHLPLSKNKLKTESSIVEQKVFNGSKYKYKVYYRCNI